MTLNSLSFSHRRSLVAAPWPRPIVDRRRRCPGNLVARPSAEWQLSALPGVISTQDSAVVGLNNFRNYCSLQMQTPQCGCCHEQNRRVHSGGGDAARGSAAAFAAAFAFGVARAAAFAVAALATPLARPAACLSTTSAMVAQAFSAPCRLTHAAC